MITRRKMRQKSESLIPDEGSSENETGSILQVASEEIGLNDCNSSHSEISNLGNDTDVSMETGLLLSNIDSVVSSKTDKISTTKNEKAFLPTEPLQLNESIDTNIPASVTENKLSNSSVDDYIPDNTNVNITGLESTTSESAATQDAENTLTVDELLTLCGTGGNTVATNFSEQFPSTSKGIKRSSPSEQISVSTIDSIVLQSETNKHRKVNIYTQDHGPQWYETHGNMPNISKPIVPSKLPEAFNFLPIFGRPFSKSGLQEFQNNKIKEFVGSGLSDAEFANLVQYCSPDNLRTGKELTMPGTTPGAGFFPDMFVNKSDEETGGHQLCVVKKYKMRTERDSSSAFLKRLKYRGIRLMPLSTQEEDVPTVTLGEPLQPGKDIIFHVRIYRPFQYNRLKAQYRGRHSTFSRDLILLGRHRLTELRDRFVCPNDIDMRVDVADHIEEPQLACAKNLFPSGFLFINNVFYVDTRAGCADISEPVRAWAAGRAMLGTFPRHDMGAARLDQLRIKLGHPEVYVHQGNCEHLFTFSEIRLLNASDPLRLAQYPSHTAISQNQTVYCTTCAEFGAKFIVTGCNLVPFDPAYFCDTCLKLYLYKDGKKIGNFKAYSYRGNETHSLKPQG